MSRYVKRRSFHGMTGTRLMRIMSNMIQRCYNPKSKEYKSYGGRGITVCDEWLKNHKAFYDWAMENGYADDLTIDRIDNTKGYSPDNCRWVEFSEQQWNKQNTLRYEYNGEMLTVRELKERGIIRNRQDIARIDKWGIEKAGDPFRDERIVNYNGRRVNLRELSEITGISYNTLNTRYSKGFTDEEIIKPVGKVVESRIVIQKTASGKEVARYNGVKDAHIKSGIRQSGISMCLNGQRKSCGGYIWEYDSPKAEKHRIERSLRVNKEGGWIDNRGKSIDAILVGEITTKG